MKIILDGMSGDDLSAEVCACDAEACPGCVCTPKEVHETDKDAPLDAFKLLALEMSDKESGLCGCGCDCRIDVDRTKHRSFGLTTKAGSLTDLTKHIVNEDVDDRCAGK